MTMSDCRSLCKNDDKLSYRQLMTALGLAVVVVLIMLTLSVYKPFVSAQESLTSSGILPRMIFGMTWMRFSAYLSLIFFVLNFATCYAMPWAKIKEPWKGDLPGKDKKDALGSFPLTHWHKIWAWLAVAALSWHGLLGFSGVLFGKWF